MKGEITLPDKPSYYPVLFVEWDPKKVGLSNGDLGKKLLAGKPRIMTHAEGDGHRFVLRPAAMYPGEHEVVAERLYEEFSNAPAPKPAKKPRPPASDVSGHWEVDIEFVASSTKMKFYLDADGAEVAGSYSSPLVPHGKVTGRMDGDTVSIQDRRTL